MKYTFKTVSNKEEWNNFLVSFAKNTSTSTPPVTFIQSFEWLDFQEASGNSVYRLGIYENNKLVGVSAGVVIRARRGKYLYVRNGPVIDWENQDLVTQTINHLKLWAKVNKLWFIRISPLIEKGTDGEKMLKSFKFPLCVMNDVEALDTWVMNLNKEETLIFDSIKKKVRYLIRSAQKENVEAFVTTDSSYIDNYFEILKDTVQRQNWNSYSKNYIKKEFETFVKDGNATIILMKYKKVFISGGIFIHFANQTFYHYGASLTKYKNVPSMYLMIWEAIKLAQSKQNGFFNFWGIAPEGKPNHPWVGLSNFKMKFPGFAQRWTHSVDIPISPLYYLTNIYERFDKSRKGY